MQSFLNLYLFQYLESKQNIETETHEGQLVSVRVHPAAAEVIMEPSRSSRSSEGHPEMEKVIHGDVW